MSDLVELARRYVSLSDQLESVRGEIAKAVLNGAGPNPTQPARASGGSQAQKMAMAAAEEAKIAELIKTTPGMRTSQIAKQTHSKANTVTQRLQRMRDRGEIVPLDGKDAGWQAAAPA
jgi:hypothetical protein